MKDYEKIEEMKKIKVDVVVELAKRICEQHLKPLKLNYNMFWIKNSVRDYCRWGDSYALDILRFLASILWWNGYQFDGDCIKKLMNDIISAKERGLIEE